MLSACSKDKLTDREKLFISMENAPFVAPMGDEDYSDPQVGYKHMPFYIKGGNYLYLNSGDWIDADRSSPKPIEFVELDFTDPEGIELHQGFRPKTAMCLYGKLEKNQWSCLIFESSEDVSLYLQSNERSPVAYIACLDCDPRPLTGLMRMCPGVYMHWTGPQYNWEDPSMPGPKYDENGSCTYDVPWWRTKKGIELGLEKYRGKLN